MLPGKSYSPEEILRILLRRGWIPLITLALGAGLAVGVSKRLPNKFRSETLIMLIPQRIPDAYVKAAVTTKIEDRLNSLEDQILSRSRLERIILDFDLYAEALRTLPMEVVVQRMRDNDITVKVEGKESFRVSYVSRDAKTAQKTTERLASLFIEESLRDRENMAVDTNQFLDSQLEEAKRQLLEHERKLEAYRTRFGGELPTQVSANLQAIQNAQVQLQNLAEAADRAKERRLLLERQIADLQVDPVVPPAQPVSAAAAAEGVSGESTAQQLQVAQSRLQLLLLHAKPDHPDVRMMQRTVRDLEAKLEIESNRPAAASPTAQALLTPAEKLRQQRIQDLTRQLQDIDRQLAEKQQQDQQLRAVVADYQARLDGVPKRESELVELTRDYTTIQATYQSLLVKREEAKLAANLERRNIGEQFKILDPARTPERPFSPNRAVIDLGGAGAGLGFGLLIIGLLEYRDSSFKHEDDVMRLLNVPVLAILPIMISDAELRTRRWRIVFICVGVLALVGSAAAVVAWRLRF